MTREEIRNWTIDTMVELFEVDRADIQEDSLLVEDLGLDSIDAIDMVVRLQELSERRINEDAAKDVRSVGDVIRMVERHLAGGI